MSTAKANAPAAVPAPATIRGKKTGLSSGLFMSSNDPRNQRPRRNEIIAPRPPINKKPAITKPIGTELGLCVSSTKVGRATGAGGVKVDKRVDVTAGIKAATRVGLIVGVEAGIGVGGTGTFGKVDPLVNDTYGA